MPINEKAYHEISKELAAAKVSLIAVSKTKSAEEIKQLYDLGQRDFGENYVQELLEKSTQLPADIRWHFIGHLQSNKVKLILPLVQLIHGVDSLKLLTKINKQAEKIDLVANCLLQVHIAKEETKFGLDEQELEEIILKKGSLKHVRIMGLMGMASFTDDMELVRSEFRKLKKMFDQHADLRILSMGMSADYQVAVEEGSNMVRIGSLIFGERS